MQNITSKNWAADQVRTCLPGNPERPAAGRRCHAAPTTLRGWSRMCAVLIFGGMSATAWGLSSDRDQELQVDAGRSVFNEDKEYYLLTDGFHLRQGTLKIDADQARVFGSFGKKFKRIVVEGNPVRMQQMLDGEPGLFKARAQVIRYNLEKDTMVLTGNVIVTQHRGQMHSERMVYDITNGRVAAGPNRGSSPGRVRMRIEPDTIKRKRKTDAQEQHPQG